MSKDIRVRYAPSPTGLLHIGNARTALFNYLYARHHGGTFIIRIEDTDRKRHVEDGERSQLENLRWLGMDWDESPETHENYRQSERLELYQKYIDQLLAEGKAYKSYVTEEELAAERERQEAAGETPRYINEYLGMSEEEKAAYIAEREAAGVIPTVRLAVNESGIYKWHDMVKGDIEFEGGNIGGDWVIQKKDGYPTYNFAVVIDDHDMQISHVIRGDDHIANTPKQLMVYEALGWEAPEFGHMTLIINSETGKKLSKRDTNTLQFIEDYRKKGYLPEAVFNFIALLGWNPGGEDEIFSREELIKLFDENRLSKSPAAFDQKKLDWMSNDYMNLDDIRHQYIDNLSGGQRQRAYIAMTLAQDTDYILLDEPLNNLDMKHSVQIMQVLRKLATELNKTVVIVIHDINFASCYSDYIVAMKNGKLVHQGEVNHIMQSPVLQDIYDMTIPIQDIDDHKIAVYFR